jgi:VanZ family protein
MIIMIKKHIYSILVALIIMYLSLASSHTFDKVPFGNFPDADKVVHFGMYFGFMSVIIFENRKTFKNIRLLFLTGLIPLFYGMLMEILQSTITLTRTGSIYDALANTSGILVSILLCLWIKPIRKEIFR